MKNSRHIFAKLIVTFCVLFAAGCSVYALRIMYQTGNDPSSLLGVILGFFGGELLLLCLKTILSKNKKENTHVGIDS